MLVTDNGDRSMLHEMNEIFLRFFFILDRHEPINGFSSREQVYNPVSKVHHTSA